MIDVKSRVTVYEVDDKRINWKETTLLTVGSRWNNRELVCIEVGGHTYTVGVNDLKAAIISAQNTGDANMLLIGDGWGVSDDDDDVVFGEAIAQVDAGTVYICPADELEEIKTCYASISFADMRKIMELVRLAEADDLTEAAT